MPEFPNLFIVGAPKCATTTLHSILNLHQNIGMSTPKELNYFSFQDLSAQNLYYDDYRVSSFKKYMNCFSLKDEYKYIGESSVSYFSYPKAHIKIYNHNNKSKIIVLLRNPVDRAFSHYLMDKRLGLVNNDFYEIFQKPEKHASHYYQYFVLSQYYKPLQSLSATFKNNLSVHILDDDESIASIAYKIINWLGLDNFDSDLDIDELKENSFFASNNKIISNVYKVYWVRNLFRKIVPGSIKKSILNKMSSEKPDLGEKTREVLIKHFSEDINNVEELIDKDLSMWKIV